MFFLYMKIDCFLFIFLLAFGKLLLQSSIKLLPISDHFLILLLNALLSHILFIFCLLQPRLRLHYIYLNLVEHIVNARRSVFFTFLQKLIEWYFVMLSGALEGCAGMLILSIFQLRQKANIFLHLTASYIILASLLGLNICQRSSRLKSLLGFFFSSFFVSVFPKSLNQSVSAEFLVCFGWVAPEPKSLKKLHDKLITLLCCFTTSFCWRLFLFLFLSSMRNPYFPKIMPRGFFDH